ncbi:ethanolamine utilization protein EutJ [Paenibacillus swuensis]|uniref:Ethanolamine utilization protein EutJ n=1 Tax=Paenibacillus swuensis TaxID=1178515 RepID=A0A172TDP5_9BACL|nr:ABC transporter substrate-binding protein [Paenibacillus swuensis]ANE45037.1 ethanolamine utilization protein EutJ [Paenibacillus swuensis]
MNKKMTGILASCVLALGVLAGCNSGDGNNGNGGTNANAGGNNGGGASAEVIKVGTNFEMTGGQASFGNSSMKGVKLAVKEINDAGGIDGKMIELVEADNASKPEESTRVAQKLISNDNVVALIGPVTSTNTLGAVPVAMEKKIPLITTSATNPKVTVDERTNKVNEWIFRACFIDPFQGKVMADFSLNDLKAKTAAMYIDTSSDYSKGLQKFFQETFTAGGGTIVSDESYQQKDTDFKAVLTRMKEKSPDVIYVPGYYEEVGKIIKQAREMGITVPILGGDGWDSPQLVEIAGAEALKNTFMSNHYAADDKSDEIVSFIDAFKKANADEVPDGLAALGYDSVKLLADAIKRAGSTDAEKLKEALAGTKDLKLATGVITLNETHDPVKSAVVLEFVDGKQTFKTKVNP